MNVSVRTLARSAAMLEVLALVLALSLWASGTTAWEMTSYNDFVQGPFRRHLPEPGRPPLPRS